MHGRQVDRTVVRYRVVTGGARGFGSRSTTWPLAGADRKGRRIRLNLNDALTCGTNGDVLDILVQTRRDTAAARRFMRKLFKRWGLARG